MRVSDETPSSLMTVENSSASTEESHIALGVLPTLVGRNLRIAHALVFKDFAFEIDGLKLTPGSFETLELLFNNPGLGPSRLASLIGLDKSSLTPALARLESLNLVERKVSNTDGRAYELRITPTGRTELSKLRAYVEEREALVTATMTVRETHELNRLLKKLAKGLSL